MVSEKEPLGRTSAHPAVPGVLGLLGLPGHERAIGAPQARSEQAATQQLAFLIAIACLWRLVCVCVCVRVVTYAV